MSVQSLGEYMYARTKSKRERERYIDTYICTYVDIHVCVNIHIYICIYIHIHTHTCMLE